MLKNCFDIAETIDCRLLQRIDRVMAMLNPMMTTDVAGNPCWMRPGGWTQVGILKTRGCMGSVVKPHKWLLLKRPWEFVKELFRTYLMLRKSAIIVLVHDLIEGIWARFRKGFFIKARFFYSQDHREPIASNDDNIQVAF